MILRFETRACVRGIPPSHFLKTLCSNEKISEKIGKHPFWEHPKNTFLAWV